MGFQESNKMWVGIDPGADGVIATYHNDWKFYPMPKIGDKVDVNQLGKIFKEISRYESVHVVIEDIHAIFGASAKSTFNFGWISGIIEGMLVSNSIPFTKIQPKTWQKEMFQGVPVQQKLSSTGKTMVNNPKLMAEIAAKRLYPDIDLRRTDRCKKSDENKVDALLIATFCKRKF